MAAALCGTLRAGDAASEVLALEREAMEGWLAGNPDKMLATADPSITYFHIVADKRMDGVAALKDLCEKYRGRPLFDSYEIVDPKVQVAGDVAVLTYHFMTRNGDLTRRWHATLVYQRKSEGWRVIHSHFSLVQAPGAPQP
jgi:hypothetical protein